MENNKKIPINRVGKFFSLYGLYSPTNNELRYVGITVNSLQSRLNNHLLNPTNHMTAKWFKELFDIGEKPIIRLIKLCDTYEDLLISEIQEIKKNRELGIQILNIADGGDINPMFGKTHTIEAREKISKTHKGRKLTDEQIKRRSELLKELWGDEEWSNNIKLKMSHNMMGNNRSKGFKHSDETKNKLSIIHSGNKYTLGFKHSDETKEKMSFNNSGENNPMYGKRLSEEVLIKRSEKVRKEGTFKGKNNSNYKYNITEGDLRYLYITLNYKIDEISNKYGCHRSVISKSIKKYNIIKEPSNKYNLNIDEILQYKLNGLNLVDIGKIYGCSNKIICKYIKKNGK